MRFIQFMLANPLRFKYPGILLLAFLPVVFSDNKEWLCYMILPDPAVQQHLFCMDDVFGA